MPLKVKSVGSQAISMNSHHRTFRITVLQQRRQVGSDVSGFSRHHMLRRHIQAMATNNGTSALTVPPADRLEDRSMSNASTSSTQQDCMATLLVQCPDQKGVVASLAQLLVRFLAVPLDPSRKLPRTPAIALKPQSLPQSCFHLVYMSQPVPHTQKVQMPTTAREVMLL